MFGRKKRDGEADLDESTDPTDHLDADDDDLDADDDGDSAEGSGDSPSGLTPRPDGPYDVSEVTDDGPWLDLGSVRIRPAEQLELRVEIDQASNQPVSVLCVTEHGAVSVQAFAAPKSEGIWADVRRDLRQQITAAGGLVDEVQGPWGTEIRTRVPAENPDGSQGSQPARFVGVDGPRWFLRLVFLGDAATDADAAARVEAVARGVIVCRDSEARAPGDLLPLTLPQEALVPGSEIEERLGLAEDGDEPAAWQREDVSPFERGPEITEIR